MIIEIVTVDNINKGKYNMLEVIYKDNTGKNVTKKVMSFGAGADAFKVLSSAYKGQQFNIESVKNDAGYWDWISATLLLGNESVSDPTPKGAAKPVESKPVARSTYETPEERAARQVFIIRQSSISAAVQHLNHVKKAYDVNEILQVASVLEQYVLGKPVVDPGNPMEGLVDSIPY